MVEPVKVLYITSVFNQMGGAEKNLYDIVLNLDRTRYTPYILCMTGGDLAQKVRSHGIHTEVIDLQKLLSCRAFWKGIGLYRFIRREQFQIVVTYHKDADYWGGGVAVLARVPVTISSRRDLGFQLESRHIKTYRYFNKLFTRILTVSDAVKKEIVKREAVDFTKLVTVYNGVQTKTPTLDIDSVSRLRKSLGIEPDDSVIGMVANFKQIKGQIHLVEAAPEIIRCNSKVKFLLVGLKELDYFEKVSSLVKELKLERYFIFPGARSDVPDLLEIMDVLVLPSLTEGFSNALLEGMAAGKAVVASDCGGNPESVIQGKTGLLVPPGDSGALADAVVQLLSNHELRSSMGCMARDQVNKTFSLKTMMNRTEELYEQLLLIQAQRRLSVKVRRAHVVSKRAAKLAISDLLFISGVSGIVRWMNRAKPLVLAYHSISKVTLRALEIETDPSHFEAQMTFLKRRYRPISLDQFLACRAQGRPLPHNAVLVTFDDGYSDFFQNAYPVLRRLEIPSVVFLTVGPVETQEALFYDFLRFAILNTSHLFLDLRDIGLEKYVLDQADQVVLSETIRRINDFSKAMAEAQKNELLDILASRLEVDRKALRERKLYLSWDEIREMSRNGVDFGSHTLSHPQLKVYDFQACLTELQHSRQIIEERIAQKVRCVAFPFGGPDDFNQDTEKAAREAGYECAFSLHPGYTKRGGEDFVIARKMVDSLMTVNLTGRVSIPLFQFGLLR